MYTSGILYLFNSPLQVFVCLVRFRCLTVLSVSGVCLFCPFQVFDCFVRFRCLSVLSVSGVCLFYLFQVFGRYYTPLLGREGFSIIPTLLHPRSRGTVTLRSDLPKDPPVIDPNFLSDPRDVEDLILGKKRCMECHENVVR